MILTKAFGLLLTGLIYTDAIGASAPVDDLFRSAQKVVEERCAKPEFSHDKRMECVAQGAKEFHAKSQQGFGRLRELAQDPASPLNQLKNDIVMTGGEENALKQARFQDSLERLLRDRPQVVEEIPELKSFLSDYFVFSNFRRTFRLGGLETGKCVYPELAHQDVFIPALKDKKCQQVCDHVERANSKGQHLVCKPIAKEARTTFQRMAQDKANKTVDTCLFDEPMLKRAPQCLGKLSSVKDRCQLGEMTRQMGLDSASQTFAYLFQAAGPCAYLHMLRMRAVTQFIAAYRELVQRNVPVPPACREHFSELFTANGPDQSIEALSPDHLRPDAKGYREQIVAAAKTIAANIASNAATRKMLREKKNQLAMLRSGPADRIVTDEEIRLEMELQSEEKSKEEEIKAKEKEILELHARFPYLAVRGHEQSAFEMNATIDTVSAAKNDTELEKALKPLKSHVGADLLNSMDAFCNPDKSRGGISGEELVTNSNLTAALLNGEHGLANIPGFAELQSCLANVAGDTTLKTGATLGITGACLTASLLAAPSVIGSFIIGAGCGLVSVAMTVLDRQEAEAQEEGLRACMSAPTVCDPGQYKLALDRLGSTENEIMLNLGLEAVSNILPVLGPSAVAFKSFAANLKRIKSGGNLARLQAVERSLETLKASQAFKQASREQKVAMLDELLKRESGAQIVAQGGGENLLQLSRIVDVASDKLLFDTAKSFARNPEELQFLLDMMADLNRLHAGDKNKVIDDFYKLVGQCQL